MSMKCLKRAALTVMLLLHVTVYAEPDLIRESYFSEVTGAERDYFVYLPAEFSQHSSWPVLLFLHGNGERGDAKRELDFLLAHGPLYEAWIQKRDLPFVIVAPQLPMYEMGEVSYIKNRKFEDIPRRLAEGVPARPPKFPSDEAMNGLQSTFPKEAPVEGPPSGWNLHAEELIEIVDSVIQTYRGDSKRTYLTGLSYGGFGVWWMASHYPERFAAANPIVGYAHPDLIDSIAAAGMPVWCFAGGRDRAVPVEHFYEGMNKLERLSSAEVRFTVEEDMNHDVWARVYAGEDLYRWLLSYSR